MSNQNALLELLDHVEKKGPIKCVQITHKVDYDNENNVNVYLPIGYTQDEVIDFHKKLLNINYDSGYGMQELYGTIWYVDGSWSERREYDGSEWWEHQVCPPVPEHLLPPVVTPS
jgi:hypothetical protein